MLVQGTSSTLTTMYALLASNCSSVLSRALMTNVSMHDQNEPLPRRDYIDANHFDVSHELSSNAPVLLQLLQSVLTEHDVNIVPPSDLSNKYSLVCIAYDCFDVALFEVNIFRNPESHSSALVIEIPRRAGDHFAYARIHQRLNSSFRQHGLLPEPSAPISTISRQSSTSSSQQIVSPFDTLLSNNSQRTEQADPSVWMLPPPITIDPAVVIRATIAHAMNTVRHITFPDSYIDAWFCVVRLLGSSPTSLTCPEHSIIADVIIEQGGIPALIDALTITRDFWRMDQLDQCHFLVFSIIATLAEHSKLFVESLHQHNVIQQCCQLICADGFQSTQLRRAEAKALSVLLQPGLSARASYADDAVCKLQTVNDSLVRQYIAEL